jgi:hypothetical protein
VVVVDVGVDGGGATGVNEGAAGVGDGGGLKASETGFGPPPDGVATVTGWGSPEGTPSRERSST